MAATTPAAAPTLPHWRRGTLETLHEHAFDGSGSELSGVLAGRFDPERSAAVVYELIVVGAHAAGTGAAFGHGAWAHIHRQLSRHPDLELVGWYVSRPGFGLFLTPAEVEMHRRYFPRAEQFALVLDSQASRGGVFARRGDRIELVDAGSIERRAIAPRPARAPVRAWAALAGGGVALGLAAWLAAGGPAATASTHYPGHLF